MDPATRNAVVGIDALIQSIRPTANAGPDDVATIEQAMKMIDAIQSLGGVRRA